MEKTPIGLSIKAVVQKKNLSPTKIARELGISKQQVYNTYMRTNLHEGELEKWANVLNVSMEELTEFKFQSDKVEAPSFGDEVLTTIKRLLEEELREKNDQIRSLQETLRQSQKALEQAQDLSSRLLGKSPERPDGRILFNVFTREETPAAIA